jgi:hypothetical protein
LRIRPGSVRAEPASPSEGETIFVHFEVENTGGTLAGEAKASLFDGPPDGGGRAAYSHNERDHRMLHQSFGRLGPGRTTPVTLRWDESFNAGSREYWIRLEPDPADGRMNPGDLVARGSVNVRTAPKPVARNVRPFFSQEDFQQGRLYIPADIRNEGETDARNVVVYFYKGRHPRDENLLGPFELGRVAANSVENVAFLWEFGDPANLADEQGERSFMVQTGFKGSRVRFAGQP